MTCLTLHLHEHLFDASITVHLVQLFQEAFTTCLYSPQTLQHAASMANLSNGCTSTNSFVLLRVAVCMIASCYICTYTVHVHQATAARMQEQ